MATRFPIKKMSDGRAMLNFGCGTRMHWGWNNLDFSPYTRLAGRPKLAALMRRTGLLSELRYERLKTVDPEIVRYDLRYGIPYDDNTFDVVYNSHVLEQIDRDAVVQILKQSYRVLKPGGILRLVVPDLGTLVENYMATYKALSNGSAGSKAAVSEHLKSIDGLYEQMMRKDVTGTLEQKGVVQRLERKVRGDASKIGETYRWMYDRHSMAAILTDIGFKDIRAEEHNTSRIANWREYELDTNADGTPYKKLSLYIEGVK
jgi:ubiquinone/menaquinone biosynthesis C-methylase UbiE